MEDQFLTVLLRYGLQFTKEILTGLSQSVQRYFARRVIGPENLS